MMTLTGNGLLDSFSSRLRSEILAVAHPCRLVAGTVLLRRAELPNHHVFLTSGLASVSVYLADGTVTEASTLGREGLTGVAGLLGCAVGNAECVVRADSSGFKVPRHHLLRLFHSSAEFQECILRLAQHQMNVLEQSSVCNLRHKAPARLVRWLLTASDQLESALIPVTKADVADMLGLRRTTVSGALQPFYGKSLVGKHRGAIQIINREGLLPFACECYEVCSAWTYRPARSEALTRPHEDQRYAGATDRPAFH
jgi:CRP-like cAMP-binding protein